MNHLNGIWTKHIFVQQEHIHQLEKQLERTSKELSGVQVKCNHAPWKSCMFYWMNVT